MACHFKTFLKLSFKVFIKSTQLRCLRNPACSFLRCCFTVFCILFKMILVRILLGILRRVTHLQLFQFDKSPFFSILIINPSSQSSGIFSSFHIFPVEDTEFLQLFQGQVLVLPIYIFYTCCFSIL